MVTRRSHRNAEMKRLDTAICVQRAGRFSKLMDSFFSSVGPYALESQPPSGDCDTGH